MSSNISCQYSNYRKTFLIIITIALILSTVFYAISWNNGKDVNTQKTNYLYYVAIVFQVIGLGTGVASLFLTPHPISKVKLSDSSLTV